MNENAYPITQLDLTPILGIGCLVLLLAISVLIFFLIGKIEELKELKSAYDKIMQAFNELDEQAKLIIKTDLELNKAQEELDRRLTGLDSLQKLARKINMTLDENDLFQRIDQTMIAEMGFSRALVLTFTDEDRIISRVNIGFEPHKIDAILSQLEKSDWLLTPLKGGMTFSSLRSSQKTKTSIVQIFDTEHFILTPLLSQQRLAGFLLVGNRYNSPAVTEGDEELISILASQLAQSMENAQLFEQVYRSSQMLETKVNERTKELTLALKTVEEISKQKTEFISAVSHELRTPLTSIKGFASLIVAGKVGELSQPVRERIERINTHADHLVKLINDLLDIARIESGRVEMKTVSQPIKPIVDNIADLLTPQLSTKGLTIKHNIPKDMPNIDIDAQQIERVFINLISNAIKFTPPNGTITINALPRQDKQHVLFEVADTGIGMKKEDLNKIFDEFYRVDNEINLSVKGTGLGLSLVKNIVEAHDGEVWATSEVGVGTTFHFILPFTHKPKEIKKQTTL